MKRKNAVKCLLVAGALCVAGGFTACKDPVNLNPNPGIYDTGVYEYTGFLPSAQETMRVGEAILISELIDIPADTEYTLTISNGEKTENAANVTMWMAEDIGTYTFTLTIAKGDYKGTYTHTLKVVTQDYIEFAYAKTTEIYYDKEMSFEEIFRNLNIVVTTHSNWYPVMLSVRVDGEVTEFSETQTSIYVSSVSDHLFTFALRTQDGREEKRLFTANVKYSDTHKDVYLSAIDDGTVTIEQAGVQSVKVNGQACADAVITDTGVSFSEKTLYKKYKGSNFISMQTAEGEYRETLNVYTDKYSFESQVSVVPPFIYWWDGRKDLASLSITNQYATDGEKALLMAGSPSNNPQFAISLEYLDMVFEDESVTELLFDMTYVGSTAAHTYRQVNTESATGGTPAVTIYSGETETIALSRATYETFKRGEGMVYAVGIATDGVVFTWLNSSSAPGGSERPMYTYLDNIRAVRALEEETLSLKEETTGTFDVCFENAASVSLNGQPIPADKVTISADVISIDKAWLMSNAGSNSLSIVDVNGSLYIKTIHVFGDFDFENGLLVKDFVFFPSMSENGSMQYVTYNDSMALKATGSHKWQVFALPGKYLDFVFADQTVGSLQFDVTLTGEPTTEATATYLQFMDAGNGTISCGFDKTRTVKVTREMYEIWQGLGMDYFRFSWGNQLENTGTILLTWYIDNVRAVEKEPEDPNLITNFDTQTILKYGDGRAIMPYYTSTSTNKNQTEAIRTGYAGQNAAKWQKEYFNTGASAQDDDYAYYMQFEDTSGTLKFGISVGFLDSIFANAAVTQLSWDFLCQKDASIVSALQTDVTQSWTASFTAGGWSTFVMTKSDYLTIKNSGNAYLTMSLIKAGTNYSGSIYVAFDNFRVEQQMTENMHTVTFDIGDAKIPIAIASQVVENGTCASNPITSVTPSVFGKAFKGWAYNGQPFDFSTPITQDITLTAVYADNAPIVDYYYLVDMKGKAGSEQGYLSYVTDAGLLPQGEDHIWQVKIPDGGYGYCWNFNDDMQVAGATQYTFKVMFDFPHTDDDLIHNSTVAQSTYYQFTIDGTSTVLINQPQAGVWYDVTISAKQLQDNGEGKTYVVFLSSGARQNGTLTAYMTDIKAVTD